MGREIKYKAWLPTIKKMTYGHTLEQWLLDFPHLEDFSEDTVWLQYTGLKDKNGREIYEGDIEDYNTHVYCDERRKGIVCFDTHKCTYKLVPVDLYKINAGNGGWSGHFFDSHIAATSEVIGNIYENPKLLEV
ncbi:YopX family protein [Paenibacillus sp. FSL R10-2796]|uniref:YopX family protein n=1 Tax=Paenibacillus sp. FSL R10-2796 TaxID=2954663 RepID=UPI0030DA3B49